MEGKKEKKRNVRHLDSDSEESGKDEKVEYEDPFVDELEEEELVEDDIEEDEEGGLPDEYIEKYKNLRISDKEFIEEKNEEEENEEKLEVSETYFKNFSHIYRKVRMKNWNLEIKHIQCFID